MVVSIAPFVGADILSVRLVDAVGLEGLVQLVSAGTEIGTLFLLRHGFEWNHYPSIGGFLLRLLVAHAPSLLSLCSSMHVLFGTPVPSCLALALNHSSWTGPSR